MGNELENLKTTANKKILEGTESIDPPQPLIMWKDFIRKREGKERKENDLPGLQSCTKGPYGA